MTSNGLSGLHQAVDALLGQLRALSRRKLALHERIDNDLKPWAQAKFTDKCVNSVYNVYVSL